MKDRLYLFRPAVVALLLVLPPAATAATLHVQPDGGGDLPTIQAALDAAGDGDVIVLADGTYAGPGNRDLDFGGKALTVRSGGDAAACVIDCAGGQWVTPHRAFRFHSGETAAAQVVALTVVNGQAVGEGDAGSGGAVFCHGSSPTIRDCVFGGNLADRGGAVAVQGASPILVGCTFVRNTAERGGAVHLAGGAARLAACRFENNTARYGGALLGNGATPVLEGCRFVANLAHRGGAVHGLDSDFTVTDGWFERNIATLGGGLFLSHAALRLAYVTFVVNTAGSGGAVLGSKESLVVLDHVVAAFNQQGGAVALDATSRAEAACSLIYGNAEGDWTGAMAALEGALGNLREDPGFTAPARGDFSLAPGSPCRRDRPGCGPLVRP